MNFDCDYNIKSSSRYHQSESCTKLNYVYTSRQCDEYFDYLEELRRIIFGQGYPNNMSAANTFATNSNAIQYHTQTGRTLVYQLDDASDYGISLSPVPSGTETMITDTFYAEEHVLIQPETSEIIPRKFYHQLPSTIEERMRNCLHSSSEVINNYLSDSKELLNSTSMPSDEYVSRVYSFNPYNEKRYDNFHQESFDDDRDFKDIESLSDGIDETFAMEEEFAKVLEETDSVFEELNDDIHVDNCSISDEKVNRIVGIVKRHGLTEELDKEEILTDEDDAICMTPTQNSSRSITPTPTSFNKDVQSTDPHDFPVDDEVFDTSAFQLPSIFNNRIEKPTVSEEVAKNQSANESCDVLEKIYQSVSNSSSDSFVLDWDLSLTTSQNFPRNSALLTETPNQDSTIIDSETSGNSVLVNMIQDYVKMVMDASRELNQSKREEAFQDAVSGLLPSSSSYMYVDKMGKDKDIVIKNESSQTHSEKPEIEKQGTTFQLGLKHERSFGIKTSEDNKLPTDKKQASSFPDASDSEPTSASPGIKKAEDVVQKVVDFAMEKVEFFPIAPRKSSVEKWESATLKAELSENEKSCESPIEDNSNSFDIAGSKSMTPNLEKENYNNKLFFPLTFPVVNPGTSINVFATPDFDSDTVFPQPNVENSSLQKTARPRSTFDDHPTEHLTKETREVLTLSREEPSVNLNLLEFVNVLSKTEQPLKTPMQPQVVEIANQISQASNNQLIDTQQEVSHGLSKEQCPEQSQDHPLSLGKEVNTDCCDKATVNWKDDVLTNEEHKNVIDKIESSSSERSFGVYSPTFSYQYPNGSSIDNGITLIDRNNGEPEECHHETFKKKTINHETNGTTCDENKDTLASLNVFKTVTSTDCFGLNETEVVAKQLIPNSGSDSSVGKEHKEPTNPESVERVLPDVPHEVFSSDQRELLVIGSKMAEPEHVFDFSDSPSMVSTSVVNTETELILDEDVAEAVEALVRKISEKCRFNNHVENDNDEVAAEETTNMETDMCIIFPGYVNRTENCCLTYIASEVVEVVGPETVTNCSEHSESFSNSQNSPDVLDDSDCSTSDIDEEVYDVVENLLVLGNSCSQDHDPVVDSTEENQNVEEDDQDSFSEDDVVDVLYSLLDSVCSDQPISKKGFSSAEQFVFHEENDHSIKGDEKNTVDDVPFILEKSKQQLEIIQQEFHSVSLADSDGKLFAEEDGVTETMLDKKKHDSPFRDKTEVTADIARTSPVFSETNIKMNDELKSVLEMLLNQVSLSIQDRAGIQDNEIHMVNSLPIISYEIPSLLNDQKWENEDEDITHFINDLLALVENVSNNSFPSVCDFSDNHYAPSSPNLSVSLDVFKSSISDNSYDEVVEIVDSMVSLVATSSFHDYQTTAEENETNLSNLPLITLQNMRNDVNANETAQELMQVVEAVEHLLRTAVSFTEVEIMTEADEENLSAVRRELYELTDILENANMDELLGDASREHADRELEEDQNVAEFFETLLTDERNNHNETSNPCTRDETVTQAFENFIPPDPEQTLCVTEDQQTLNSKDQFAENIRSAEESLPTSTKLAESVSCDGEMNFIAKDQVEVEENDAELRKENSVDQQISYSECLIASDAAEIINQETLEEHDMAHEDSGGDSQNSLYLDGDSFSSPEHDTRSSCEYYLDSLVAGLVLTAVKGATNDILRRKTASAEEIRTEENYYEVSEHQGSQAENTLETFQMRDITSDEKSITQKENVAEVSVASEDIMFNPASTNFDHENGDILIDLYDEPAHLTESSQTVSDDISSTSTHFEYHARTPSDNSTTLENLPEQFNVCITRSFEVDDNQNFEVSNCAVSPNKILPISLESCFNENMSLILDPSPNEISIVSGYLVNKVSADLRYCDDSTGCKTKHLNIAETCKQSESESVEPTQSQIVVEIEKPPTRHEAINFYDTDLIAESSICSVCADISDTVPTNSSQKLLVEASPSETSLNSLEQPTTSSVLEEVSHFFATACVAALAYMSPSERANASFNSDIIENASKYIFPESKPSSDDETT